MTEKKKKTVVFLCPTKFLPKNTAKMRLYKPWVIMADDSDSQPLASPTCIVLAMPLMLILMFSCAL